MYRVRFRDPAGAVRQGTWDEGTVSFAGDTYDVDEVDILAPVEPSKVVCLAGNYIEHAHGEIPDRPELFLKGPNAVASHGDTIELPERPDRLEYEAEVGVVIGQQCRHVTEEEAMDVVAGYTNVNDVSNRDDQAEERNWVRGKAFDGSAPMGPVVATPEHIDNPEDPRIRLWRNGEKEQDSNNDELIFPVSEVIAEVTELLTLEAGDVIAMGTSGHPEALEDGDEIEIKIDGVPRLRHDVTIP